MSEMYVFTYLFIYLLCWRLFILNNTVCQEEILSSAKRGDSVKYCSHSVGCSFLLRIFEQPQNSQTVQLERR